MRAERSIRRADLCILIVDLTMGVTAQDKRIAGLIQKAAKAAIVVLNKWDLIRPKRREKQTIAQLVDETRARIFFLDYAPVLVASALTGENVDKLFALIERVRHAAQQRIGTGVLNRLLQAAFAANPPPMISGRRLKLFYAAQAQGESVPSATGRIRPTGEPAHERKTRSTAATARVCPFRERASFVARNLSSLSRSSHSQSATLSRIADYPDIASAQ